MRNLPEKTIIRRSPVWVAGAEGDYVFVGTSLESSVGLVRLCPPPPRPPLPPSPVFFCWPWPAASVTTTALLLNDRDSLNYHQLDLKIFISNRTNNTKANWRVCFS